MTTEINKNVYYVGDLCYVMTNEWDEICDLSVFDNSKVEFTLEDGRKYIQLSTAFGDGTYNDLDGNPYSDDSGTIGAVLVNNITDTEALNEALGNGLGHLHTFDTELTEDNCFYDNMVLHIVDVTIDTDWGTDSDDEELDVMDEDEILEKVALFG